MKSQVRESNPSMPLSNVKELYSFTAGERIAVHRIIIGKFYLIKAANLQAAT